MPHTETAPTPTTRPDLRHAYLMIGVALGCIWFSYLMGALFSPGFVTGTQHDHFNSAAVIGWIFDAIATGLVVTAALEGIRAKVTDKPPWTPCSASASARSGSPSPDLDPVQVRQDRLVRNGAGGGENRPDDAAG